MQKSINSGLSIKTTVVLLWGMISGMMAIPYKSQAQGAMTAVPFLQINNDARSMGMSGANMAMRGARSGIHLNPAAFGKPGIIEATSQINFDDTGYFFGTPWLTSFHISDMKIVTPQFITGFEKFSLGYQYTYLDLGKQTQTGPDGPESIGTFRSREYAHTFSAAYHVNEHVSVGGGVNFIKSDLAIGVVTNGSEIQAAERTTWDIGVYADYPFEKEQVIITPSFGWSITDFGQPIRYAANTLSDPLPITMRAGFGLEVATKEDQDGRQAMRITGFLSRMKIMARREADGNAMGPFKVLFNSWGPITLDRGIDTVRLSLRDQNIRLHGLEFTLYEFLSIRVGHHWEHKYNGDRKYTTVGFGVNYKYFSLDYAEMFPDENGHPLEDTEYLQFTASLPLELLGKWLE